MDVYRTTAAAVAAFATVHVAYYCWRMHRIENLRNAALADRAGRGEREARLAHARALDAMADRVAAPRGAAAQPVVLRGSHGGAVDGLEAHVAAVGADGAANPQRPPHALRNQIWTALVCATVFAVWFCLCVCLLHWLLYLCARLDIGGLVTGMELLVSVAMTNVSR